MLHLPFYVPLVFGLTVIVTLIGIISAANFKKPFVITLLSWIVLQSVLGLTGFYTSSQVSPPRFPLLILPPLLFIGLSLLTIKGRTLLNGFNIKTLTLLHMVRIPVELTLYWLFLHKAVPEILTFEGRNFDILSGLSAPFIYYFGFIKKSLGTNWLIAWNIACLVLLTNVVVNSVLSAPTPFQKFAFDQPNIAMGYFPFMLLPSFLVPVVVLAHVVSLRQLSKNKLLNRQIKF